MKLFSTGGTTESTDFRTAVRQGLAPDGGLYMPQHLPYLSTDIWNAMKGATIAETARNLFDLLLSDDFDVAQRGEIVDRAFTFDAPVVSLDEKTHVLELFHGPTLAFKDFGARTMAAMLSVMARDQGETISIVTATSGDTGAAVAHGFHGAPGVEVFVLYPGGQVSPLQEKQFTTLGDNIIALEVDGTFDDCQRLVKACFADPDILSGKQLTTANSINIARLIPQMVYYIHAVTAIHQSIYPKKTTHSSILCSVPSGNFGNLTAGLLAHKMGLPVSKFIAATNSNHIVPDYLADGTYRPKPSLRTISNAMDVGNPSNFDRMLDLYSNNHEMMAQNIQGAWFTDEQTGEAITEVWETYGYVMDPHTAVGYLGFRQHRGPDDHGLILSTAHPAKFPETIDKLIPGALVTPERLSKLVNREKKSIPIPADLEAVKRVLLQDTEDR